MLTASPGPQTQGRRHGRTAHASHPGHTPYLGQGEAISELVFSSLCGPLLSSPGKLTFLAETQSLYQS